MVNIITNLRLIVHAEPFKTACVIQNKAAASLQLEVIDVQFAC